jgi:predicted nucleic acid-binding protein
LRTNLIDAGPLVAFLNRRDRHHRWAIDTLAAIPPPLLTCEAVLSEAIYLVRDLPGGGESILEMVRRSVVRPVFRLEEQVAAVQALLARYRDVTMDLADACLVRMAEVFEDPVVITIDTEFRDIYRRHSRKAIPTILPPRAKKRKKGISRK